MTTRRETRIWQYAGGLFAVVCSVLFWSCTTSESPLASMTAPTSVAAPTVPAAAPVANWTLTSVLVAVTGPDNCFTQQQRSGIPRSAVELMTITGPGSGNTLTFDHDTRNAPTDDSRESGTRVDNEFTARSETVAVSFPHCPDGTVLTGTLDASVIGRFSDDGQHITAQERWAYHFSSGEVALLFDWSADRR